MCVECSAAMRSKCRKLQPALKHLNRLLRINLFNTCWSIVNDLLNTFKLPWLLSAFCSYISAFFPLHINVEQIFTNMVSPRSVSHLAQCFLHFSPSPIAVFNHKAKNRNPDKNNSVPQSLSSNSIAWWWKLNRIAISPFSAGWKDGRPTKKNTIELNRRNGNHCKLGKNQALLSHTQNQYGRFVGAVRAQCVQTHTDTHAYNVSANVNWIWIYHR